MSIVAEVIMEHLRSNRRLVVPNFGAFMVKESGERIFSDILRTDDGVLTSLLRNRGLNEMEAAVTIDRFIFEMRHDLEQYGYYRLGEIGTLRVEPDTKCLRLNPPVQGEMPKAKPYIPQPIVEREDSKESTECKTQTTPVINETPTAPHKPIVPRKPAAYTSPKKAAPPRKRFDFVVVAAVVIVAIALIAIGYGYYVSTLAECNDDAAMEALRVAPEQTRN